MPDNKKFFVIEILWGAIPATLLMIVYGFFYGLVILLGGLYEVGFFFIPG